MDPSRIDARGLMCPMPVIRLQEGIRNTNDTKRFELLATDPGVTSDVPIWCRIHGHSIVEFTEIDYEFRFLIEVGSGTRQAHESVAVSGP